MASTTAAALRLAGLFVNWSTICDRIATAVPDHGGNRRLGRPALTGRVVLELPNPK